MSDEYSSLLDGFFNDAAQRGAAGVLEDKNKVTRSYELSKATGVAPGAILGDVEGFEQRLQARTAAEIIRGSPELSAWINGDPLRGGLASGDLGNLDSGLSRLGAYGKESGKRFLMGLTETAVATPLRGFGAIGTGLKEDTMGTLSAISRDLQLSNPVSAPIELARRLLFGQQKLNVSESAKEGSLYKAGEAVSGFVKELLEPKDILHPLIADLSTGLGSLGANIGLSLIPFVGRPLAMGTLVGGGMGEAAERAVKAGATPEQIVRATSLGTYAGATDFADLMLLQVGSTGKAMGLLSKIGMRALAGAFIEGGQEGLQQLIQNAIAKGVYKPDQGLMEDVPYNALLGGIIGSGARVGLGAAEDWKARREMRAVEEFTANGEEPPVGLSETIDDIKAKKISADLKALEETQRAFDQSELKTTNPDQLVELIRLHTDQMENSVIRVSSDAVLNLYGSKTPALDDGLLGFTPALVDQLKVAAVAGGDIHIPLADWLGNIDQTVYRELKEDIRTQETGLTLREAEALRERNKAVDVSEMAEETKNLKLKAEFQHPEEKSIIDQDNKSHFEGYKGYHKFLLEDENGKVAAILNLTEYKDGKALWVDYIGARKDLGRGLHIPLPGQGQEGGAWSLGPNLMLSVAKQVREQFPDAEEVSGYRVSGARTGSPKAITRKFDLKSDDDMIDFIGDLFWPKLHEEVRRVYGLETPIGRVIEREPLLSEYDVSTPIRWTPEQIKAIDIAEEIVKRISGGKVTFDPVGTIEHESGRVARGQFIRFTWMPPLIRLAFENNLDTAASARHETIHYLRKYGFFEKEEWETIAKAAEEGSWLEKNERLTPELREFYKAKGQEDILIEEAVADEFAAWAKERDQAHPLAKFFQKLWDMLQEIKLKVREALGGKANVEDLFRMAETGAIGGRKTNRPMLLPEGSEVYPVANQMDEVGAATRLGKGRVQASDQLEPEEPKAPEGVERSVFERALKGMTQAQYNRYMRLMERQNKEDYEWELAKAQREEKRRQTEEWKYQEKLAREQAKEEVENSSGITLLRMLRDGEFRGQKMPRLRLDEALLTDEQKAELPKDYYRPRGTSPDDLAQLFGYPNGEALINDLVMLEKKRGIGRFENFIQRQIDERTDALMKEAFGDLEENILQEAKDRVVGVTAADILWEDMIRFAVLANTEMAFTKNDVAQWVEQEYANLPVKLGTMDRFLKEVGRAYKAMEDAFLKGDVQEAFKQSQRRVFNHALAQQAKVFEKRVKRFDKLAERFKKREVKSVEQEYTNFIHQLLVKAGYPVQRSVQDIQNSILQDGNTTLDSFVVSKTLDGWELAVSDGILSDNVKPLEQMTIEDFREFSDAITSLASVGRKVKQIEVAGKQIDYEEWRDKVVANIKELPFRAIQKQRKLLFRYDALMVRMEEIVKDLDLRRELGPLFRGLIEPMMDAKHKSYLLQEKLSKRLTAIKGKFGRSWQATLKDTIPQNFFYDPQFEESPQGPTLFDIDRQMMINIMLNFGNRSNIKKFTEGYAGKEHAGALEAKLREMFEQHATKEDWEYVQEIWDIFNEWRSEVEVLYHNLSGLAPKMVEAEPIKNRHGEFKGGYFPLIRDHMRSQPIKGEDDPQRLFGSNYFRAATANHYTKERTNATYKVDFNNTIESLGARMQQVMHDIAFRSVVIQANKIINDPVIKKAIERHYGEEYARQLDPWVRDIANHFNMNERAIADANSFMRRMRLNLMSHALGLNLKVIGSPDVGLFNPKVIAEMLAMPKFETSLAWKHSKEIPHTYRNMDRDFRERLETIILKNGWKGMQADAVRWGFIPLVKVSQGFRIATFNTKFREAIAEGHTEEEASTIADSYVRERHGSSGLPDLPAIMRGNEGMKISTLFYGYFNTMYNWQRQLPGQVRRGDWNQMLGTIYGSILIPAMFGALLFNQQKEKDSWFFTIAKAMLLQPLSTLVFAREGASYLIEGFPQRSPWESFFTAVGSLGRDARRAYEGKKVKKPIQHTANVLGLASGLPLGQIGRSAQFLHDVNTGAQNPRNFIEWVRGIIHGEARLKK